MRFIQRSAAALSIALVVAACGLAACADDGANETATSGSGTSGGGMGPSGSGTGGISNACAEAVITPEQAPLTMYIMFDKSGSMLFDQKWAGAVSALIAFFQDPDSAGLNVALRFFPDDAPTAGCNEVA